MSKQLILKIYINIIAFLIAISCWSQKIIKKDSLFLNFDTKYITVKNNNYDQIYFFQFKNEKFVTSAFGKITTEDLFYFIQEQNKISLVNSRKPIDLKKFFSINSKIFLDKSTQKLDSYKKMRFFDRYVVFFLVKNKFILVKASASLAE